MIMNETANKNKIHTYPPNIWLFGARLILVIDDSGTVFSDLHRPSLKIRGGSSILLLGWPN